MTVPAVAAPPQSARPFKGLTPYTERDAAFFFGRDDEVEVVIANLEARRLTLLYGESGVGKSSLLRAGVVHRLRALATENLEEIGTPEFVPVYFAAWRDDPLAALLEEIRRSVSTVLGKPAQEVPASGRLDDALELWSTRAAADILIVLDQFEEYFAYHELDEGDGTLAGELPRVVNNPRVRARFLISIREDALAKLDRFKREIPTLFSTYLRARHLDRDAARQAITGPIEEYNRPVAPEERVEVEPKLVETVLDQVTAGRVVLEQALRIASGDGAAAGEERIETPYLQLVMTRLWSEEMSRGSRLLRLATLDELGGAETIVRTHLDQALGALPPDAQDVVADLFHYLVTPTGTKIAHAVPDLAAYTGRSEKEIGDVLEQLIGGEARILRPVAAPTGQDGPPRYEIFHDVLGPAVLDWRTRHVRGRLEQEKDQAEERASAEHRRARIFRALAIGALVLFIAAAGVLAFVEKQRADLEKQRSESRSLAAKARDALDGSLDTAILRAVEATAWADTFEARRALLATMHRSAGLRRVLHFRTAMNAMAIDPVGGRIAIALRDGTLVLRSRDGGVLATHHYKHSDLQSAAFSPDGRRLAVGRGDGSIAIITMRAQSTNAKLTLKTSRILQASGGVEAIAFSSDGRWLAAGGYGGIALWDLRRASTAPMRGRRLPSGSVVAFSPTQPSVLAIAGYGDVVIWNVNLRRTLHRLHQAGDVRAVAFSPDGRTLASGGYDKIVRIWRPAGSKKPRRLLGHTGAVLAVAFSPDGTTLASGGEDRTVILWDVRTARKIGEPIGGRSNWVVSLAFDRQRKTLAVASLDSKVSLWNIPERNPGRKFDVAGRLTAVTFSRDGKSLALTDDGRVLQRAAAAPNRPGRVLGHAYAIAFSPTDNWLAAATAHGVRLWDLRGQKPKLRRLRNADDSAEYVAFSRVGTLAAVTESGTVRLWNPAEGKQGALIAEFRPPKEDRNNEVRGLAFSPDGKLVAVGYWDASGEGSVVLWPMRSRKPRGPIERHVRPITMPGGHPRPVLAVAFSPDGTTLASAGRDSTIKLWSVEQRRLLGVLIGHTDNVTSLAFSPDGTTLASGSDDETVRLWDVKERQALGEPLTVGAKVTAVAFRPDGSRTGARALAAARTDGALSIWDARLWSLGSKVDLGRLRHRLCQAAGGDLSQRQRAEQFTARLRTACGWH